jgi:hypothetical protein
VIGAAYSGLKVGLASCAFMIACRLYACAFWQQAKKCSGINYMRAGSYSLWP